MSSLQRHIAAITDTTTNLITQLRELNLLREQVRKAEEFYAEQESSDADKFLIVAHPEQFVSVDKNCSVCFGVGWVCESHPDRAWHEELGCMCGAGMPCNCNSGEEPDVSQVLIDEKDATRH